MRWCSSCDQKHDDVVIYTLISQGKVKIFVNDYLVKYSGSHKRFLISRDLP